MIKLAVTIKAFVPPAKVLLVVTLLALKVVVLTAKVTAPL